MGYQFRLLEKDDEIFWRSSEDKESAIRELIQRNEMRGGDPDAVPYYLTGRKQFRRVEPTYFNGRLRTTAFGQTRHYIDEEFVSDQDLPISPTIDFNPHSR